MSGTVPSDLASALTTPFTTGRIARILSSAVAAIVERSQAQRDQRHFADAAVVMGV